MHFSRIALILLLTFPFSPTAAQTPPATKGGTPVQPTPKSAPEPGAPSTVIQELQKDMKEILKNFDDSIAKFVDAQKQPSIPDARKFIDDFLNQHRNFLSGFGPGSARMRAIQDALEFAKQQQERIAKKNELTEAEKKPLLEEWAKIAADAKAIAKDIGENNAALDELSPRLSGHRNLLSEYEILRKYGDALVKLKEMADDLRAFRKRIEDLLNKLPDRPLTTN